VGPNSPPSGSSAHEKIKEKQKEKENIHITLILFLRKFSGDPPYAKKDCINLNLRKGDD
jgi:hypothetical protein